MIRAEVGVQVMIWIRDWGGTMIRVRTRIRVPILPILIWRGHQRRRAQNNAGSTNSYRSPIGQRYSWRRHVRRVVTDWLLRDAALQP